MASPRTAMTRTRAAAALAAVAVALAGVAAPGAAAAAGSTASTDRLADLFTRFAEEGPPLMSGDGLFKKFVDRAAAPCQDEGTCGAAATTLLGGDLVEDGEGRPDPFRTLAGLAKEAFGSGQLPEMPQKYVKQAAAFFDELPDTAKARIVKAAKAMGKEVKIDDLPWMKED